MPNGIVYAEGNVAGEKGFVSFSVAAGEGQKSWLATDINKTRIYL